MDPGTFADTAIHVFSSEKIWMEKFIEVLLNKFLEVLLFVIIVERLMAWREHRREKKKAETGDYSHRLVVSVTSLVRTAAGELKLHIRSMGPEVDLKSIVGSPEDYKVLMAAVKKSQANGPLLNLPPEAEARLVPNLRSYVSGLIPEANLLWLAESTEGQAANTCPFHLVLTCERGAHVRAVKVRLLVVSPETLARLPAPEDFGTVELEQPHHVERLSTIRLIKEHEVRKTWEEKPGYPTLQLPASFRA